MPEAPDRLRTLHLIIDTLKRTDEDPALRLAEIRGILYGGSNQDPELAALMQPLPPIEAEVEHLDRQALVAGNDLYSIIQRREAARKTVSDLCHGRRRWTMSIPAREDDTDLTISRSLRDIDHLLERLKAGRQREEQLTRELDSAQRAWVVLWHAADDAETYLAETVKDSVLHRKVYIGIIDHNPGSALFEKYQEEDNDDVDE